MLISKIALTMQRQKAGYSENLPLQAAKVLYATVFLRPVKEKDCGLSLASTTISVVVD